MADNTQIRVDAQTENQAPKVDTKKKVSLKFMRDKDREKVKGIFRFYEAPGHTLSFSIRLYKEDPVETFNLVDGQVYSLPLGIAKHLNKNGWYPVHQFMTDENGNKIAKVGTKVRRFGFQSLEFIDIDDLTPVGTTLTTVEMTNI